MPARLDQYIDLLNDKKLRPSRDTDARRSPQVTRYGSTMSAARSGSIRRAAGSATAT